MFVKRSLTVWKSNILRHRVKECFGLVLKASIILITRLPGISLRINTIATLVTVIVVFWIQMLLMRVLVLLVGESVGGLGNALKLWLALEI